MLEENRPTFRIMAFDPGTVTIGVAYYDIDATTLEIIDVDTALYDLSVAYVEHDLVEPLHARLAQLYNRVVKDMREFDPKFVAIENGFANRHRPGAFGPISKSINVLELAVTHSGIRGVTFKFAPKYIKKITSGHGAAFKNDMFIGVKGIPEIAEKVDVTFISEHEVDALAIGYTMLGHLRTNHHLLLLS